MSGTYNRPNKAKVRHDGFEHIDRLSAHLHKSILTLPSREALCVHELHRMGMIDHDTRHIWVENDNKRRPFLDFERAKFRSDIDIRIGDLEDVVIDRDLDLVNADMESGITARLATWLSGELAPRLVPGADFVATFTQWSRNNPLYEWLKEEQDNCVLTDQIRRLRIQHGTYDPKVIIPLALLFSALQMEVSGTVATFEYGDGRMKMITVAIPNIHRGDSPWPTIPEVLDHAKLEKRTFARGTNTSKEMLDRVQAKLETMLMQVDEADGQWIVTLRQSRETEIARYPSLEEVAERFQA